MGPRDYHFSKTSAEIKMTQLPERREYLIPDPKMISSTGYQTWVSSPEKSGIQSRLGSSGRGRQRWRVASVDSGIKNDFGYRIPVKVCFNIDVNDILNVSAEHVGTGLRNEITIANDKGRLSKEDIERIIRDGKKYKLEDEEFRGKVDARIALEDYAYNMRDAMRCEARIGADDKVEIKKAFESAMEWLKSNKLARVDDFKEKMEELKRIYNNIQAKMLHSMEQVD